MFEIEFRIQYTFKNKDLLKQALTHRSISSKKNYEKLEFLGDSIINFYTTNWLFKNYINENEAELSIRRAQLVSQKKLAIISQSLRLYKSIRINKNINISNRIHCDIFESMIGAIYLDSNYKKVSCLLDKISVHFKDSKKNYDFKGLIISLHKKGKVERFKLDTIKYKNSFLTEMVLENYYFYGFGKTKKNAEMRASTSAYNFIQKYL